jgi:hypothetical protein
MVGPLGVLPVVLTVATTEVEETLMAGPLGVLLVEPIAATTWPQGIDGGSPRGCCQWVLQ